MLKEGTDDLWLNAAVRHGRRGAQLARVCSDVLGTALWRRGSWSRCRVDVVGAGQVAAATVGLLVAAGAGTVIRTAVDAVAVVERRAVMCAIAAGAAGIELGSNPYPYP